MKLVINETAPSGKPRYVFATSRMEMEIVLGCLRNYKSSIPIGDQWRQEYQCVSNMVVGIEKALHQKD